MRRVGSSAVVSVVVVLALTFSGVSFGAQALASSNAAERFASFSFDGTIDPAFLPFGARPDRPVVVMLKLPGDPVAVVEGNLGMKLPATQKEAIKAELRSQQDALKPVIEALGGKVLGQYQVVYNGIKVQIPRARTWEMARLTDAIDMSPVGLMEPDNTASIPLIGAPAVWAAVPGFRGEGIKVAIIDTGIDFTHANFGGPGTAAAYTAAHAAEALPASPALFGPAALKVKGGTDLVGDAYDGDTTPMPDPNPLDCNGHGSHVAGTAAGFGVLSTGGTYAGPYNPSIYATTSFEIGPGVAPLADLYAIRVFGCEGFTRVVVDALEWAVDHDMDVINMSLGSVFGTPDSSSAEASNNAAKAGVIVVASAGNSGSSPYITGSPAVADRAISVAASEAIATIPGATTALSGGGLATPKTITMQNSNGAAFTNGLTLPIKVLKNPDGTVKLGCSPSDYVDVTGKLVVTLRGVCARVARAIFGQQAGAAAVAMINTDSGFPPFEDQITRNPDTGVAFTVTIPFFGVRGVLGPAPTADGDDLVTANGGSATLTNTVIPNPGFKRFAGFTSGGPRSDDSVLKPDITAPGVGTKSTDIGTGNRGTRLSGTSMAAPHVTGVAALVRQAHPDWKVGDIKAAIVNTGSPSDVPDYKTSRGGTGLVQAGAATKTSVVAFGDKNLVSLSFGFFELSRDFARGKDLHIRNHGTAPATFTLAAAGTSPTRPHTVGFSSTTVTVAPGETEEVEVTLLVPAATAGNSFPSSANRQAFREVVGLITLTPAAGSNSGIALRVPYYLVPRALSDVKAKLSEDFGPANPSGMVTLTNRRGPISGAGDFYAWGLKDKNEHLGEHDLRAVGVQSFPFPSATDPTRRLIVFAVNTFQKWSSPSVDEFDVLVDVNGDGVDDFDVVGVDLGLVLTGRFDGRFGSFVFALPSFSLVGPVFFATAPTDSSTVLLPLLSSQIGVSPSNPRFSYHAESFSLRGFPADVMPGLAKFNAYTPAISNGDFIPVVPGATATTAVTIDAAEWAITPALGLMIVVLDNASGTAEARLLEVETD